MGFFKSLFGFPTAILKAVVAFDESDNATVEFEKLNPELKSLEYIRIVLHYYAKVLYIFDPNQEEANSAVVLLLIATEKISQANLEENKDILKIADIDDVTALSNIPIVQKHRFVATLYAGLGVERHIKTDIPFRGYLQHMAFSVLVLIQGVLTNLKRKEMEILQLSLKFMNEQYRGDVDFRDIKNLESVPTNAYVLATRRISTDSE